MATIFTKFTRPRSVVVLLQLAFASAVWAEPTLPPGMPDGGCWSAPENVISVDIYSDRVISNSQGYSMFFSPKTSPDSYSIWCYSSSGKKSAMIYKSEILQPASDMDTGKARLTDDLDYSVKIFIDGSIGAIVPFNDYLPGKGDSDGPAVKGISELLARKVSQLTVNVKFRRTIIGGAVIIPGGLPMFNLYRYVYKGQPSPVPILRFVTKLSTYPVKIECAINGGQIISVPFGTIDSSLLTRDAATSLFRTSRGLSYRCNSKLSQDIKVNLAAEPAGFADAIQTSNPDIGVIMLHKDQKVKPGDGFRSRLEEGSSTDDVTFAVVGNGKKPATGPFTGSATLVISSL